MFLFEHGDEFVVDGGAVGADVSGIYVVGVVVVRIGVLNVDDDDMREAARCPVLEEAIAQLLAPIVASFGVGGRNGGELRWSDADMVVVLIDDDGKLCVPMF